MPWPWHMKGSDIDTNLHLSCLDLSPSIYGCTLQLHILSTIIIINDLIYETKINYKLKQVKRKRTQTPLLLYLEYATLVFGRLGELEALICGKVHSVVNLRVLGFGIGLIFT